MSDCSFSVIFRPIKCREETVNCGHVIDRAIQFIGHYYVIETMASVAILAFLQCNFRHQNVSLSSIADHLYKSSKIKSTCVDLFAVRDLKLLQFIH
jgi:hypothetical protein